MPYGFIGFLFGNGPDRIHVEPLILRLIYTAYEVLDSSPSLLRRA